MEPEDIAGYIDNLRGRFAELEERMADPAIYARGAEFRSVSQEHRKLGALFEKFESWKKALSELADNREMLTVEEDGEMRDLLTADIASLEEKSTKLEEEIQVSLLPPDPNDAKNIIVEIKPAAGGDEAALFAGELFRAYLHFAEKQGWKVEILDQSDTDLGGIKDVSFSLSGCDVFSLMKYESGVHRVQRVPATEAGGRIHTSTVTVAVMPEAEEVELDIRPEDLRFDVFRSSGPGGQCVNTTDSAVRLTHIPTGIVVTCQNEKSQLHNKEAAFRVLKAKLYELEERKRAEELSELRGDRMENSFGSQIRNYVLYPYQLVKDVRSGVETGNVEAVLGGDLEQFVVGYHKWLASKEQVV